MKHNRISVIDIFLIRQVSVEKRFLIKTIAARMERAWPEERRAEAKAEPWTAGNAAQIDPKPQIHPCFSNPVRNENGFGKFKPAQSPSQNECKAELYIQPLSRI